MKNCNVPIAMHRQKNAHGVARRLKFSQLESGSVGEGVGIHENSPALPKTRLGLL